MSGFVQLKTVTTAWKEAAQVAFLKLIANLKTNLKMTPHTYLGSHWLRCIEPVQKVNGNLLGVENISYCRRRIQVIEQQVQDLFIFS